MLFIECCGVGEMIVKHGVFLFFLFALGIMIGMNT